MLLSTWEELLDKFHWEPLYMGSERVFGEFITAEWMLEAELYVSSCCPPSIPLYKTDIYSYLETPIIAVWLSSDKTQVTRWGNRDVYPIYMMFGNHSAKFRESPSGKKLVGYLPSDFKIPSEIPSKEYPVLRSWIWHRCMSFLLHSLDVCQSSGTLNTVSVVSFC